jgi:hypothetical protein
MATKFWIRVAINVPSFTKHASKLNETKGFLLPRNSLIVTTLRELAKTLVVLVGVMNAQRKGITILTGTLLLGLTSQFGQRTWESANYYKRKVKT